LQVERATAADAIAAALYHAAGYFVPCNQVVFFHRGDLQIGPRARAELLGGAEVPLTEAMVDAVLRSASRLGDGRYRAVLSRLVEGEPLGPWSYEGLRGDDPNDAVPHEVRR